MGELYANMEYRLTEEDIDKAIESADKNGDGLKTFIKYTYLLWKKLFIFLIFKKEKFHLKNSSNWFKQNFCPE